jgi:hypothetical protein
MLRFAVFLFLIFVAVWAGVRVAHAGDDAAIYSGVPYTVAGSDGIAPAKYCCSCASITFRNCPSVRFVVTSTFGMACIFSEISFILLNMSSLLKEDVEQLDATKHPLKSFGLFMVFPRVLVDPKRSSDRLQRLWINLLAVRINQFAQMLDLVELRVAWFRLHVAALQQLFEMLECCHL